MRPLAVFPVTLGFALCFGVGLSRSASAQAPSLSPAAARGTVIERAVPPEPTTLSPTAGQPTPGVQAPQPESQTPGQPTTGSSAPEGVTPVTGSSGTTPIGGSPSGATASSSQASTASYTSDKRGYTAAKYGLALDGVQVGFVKSVEGGTATAEVIEETVGPGSEVKKHIGPPRYEDIAVNIGWDSKLLLDWVATSWKAGYQRKNGSVLEADYSSQIRNEREFFNALVSGVTMPTLDLSSKDAASIVVNFAPEYTRSKAASGLLKVPDLKAQKRWLASTFRFEMSGLDGTKVNKIESFTVSQKVVNDDIGDARDAAKAPGKLNFPNLKVTLSESSSQGWWDWYNDFLIQGNNTEDKERNGSIVYLDPSLKIELGRINLYNCGIFGLAPKKMEAGADGIRRVEADLYCEKMELVTKSS